MGNAHGSKLTWTVKKRTTHGDARTRFYTVWSGLKMRCLNPNEPEYKNYGGRGIKVCREWMESYVNFRNDMKEGYSRGLTLERIDVNGDYCKTNCCWVTRKQQGSNLRKTRIIDTPLGPMIMAEAIRQSGVNGRTFRDRVKRGWPTEDLFKPAFSRGRWG